MSSPTFLINFSAPHLGPQMEWISSTLSENNHTFLVWHEKPTFVASCGLMCPQNHTCVGRCGLVVASRACFPCKKSHPDPRTTRNFRHFRQGFKQDSKVRRLGRHFATRIGLSENCFSVSSAQERLVLLASQLLPSTLIGSNNVQVARLVMGCHECIRACLGMFLCISSQYSSKPSSGVGKW